MPKLHLKRTRAEELDREARKLHKDAQRTARRQQQRHRSSSLASLENNDDPGPSRPLSRSRSPKRRRRPTTAATVEDFLSDDESTNFHAEQTDYEAIRARLEEQRFREKMLDAMEDDEMMYATSRLDGVEARMNEYAHVPRRWRGASGSGPGYAHVYGEEEDTHGGNEQLDPQMMDDDEYAEWLRASMWRKKNSVELAELERRKAERRARREREKILKKETARLEARAESERMVRKAAWDRRRLEDARVEYEDRWKALLKPLSATPSSLRFDDVPWPVLTNHPHSRSLAVDDLTTASISSFLLLPSDPKARRDKLRDTLLRFHPDKFDSKIACRVVEAGGERARAIDAAGVVVRTLNELMQSI